MWHVHSVIRCHIISDGYVGNVVKVLRDSGYCKIVVKGSSVKDEQMLESKQKCMLLDDTARNVPVVRIEIDLPYCTGIVHALCMLNPLYNLIIGNITSMRNPHDPDPNWSPKNKRSDGPEPKGQRPYNKDFL